MRQVAFGFGALAIGITAAHATMKVQPPQPETAYAPSAARYVSVDGRSMFSINQNTHWYAHVTHAKPIPPGAPVPTDLPPFAEENGIAANCAATLPAPCLQFAGYAVAFPPARLPVIGAKWQMPKWRFEVVSCLFKTVSGCRVHLMTFEGEKSRGWYWWSAERGVEAFGLAGTDGQPVSSYALVSAEGLLK
jgi:hypothetical protein